MIHLIKNALKDTGPCGGYNQEETLTPLDFDLPPDDPVLGRSYRCTNARLGTHQG